MSLRCSVTPASRRLQWGIQGDTWAAFGKRGAMAAETGTSRVAAADLARGLSDRYRATTSISRFS